MLGTGLLEDMINIDGYSYSDGVILDGMEWDRKGEVACHVTPGDCGVTTVPEEIWKLRGIFP